jgi:hypothetical protein
LSGTTSTVLSDPYVGTPAGKVVDLMNTLGGTQPGDPDKGAERILEHISGEKLGAEAADSIRLLLGSDSLVRMEKKLKGLQNTYEKCQNIAKSTDYDQK